jgi:uncharacterized repeat protein (TIGR03803 family)
MTNTKIVLSKVAHSQRLKSFRTTAALILTTLMLMVAAGTTVATAQTYTDLFNFDGTDGRSPAGILAQGRDGNLYGTTAYGGINHCHGRTCGVVFKITPSGKLKVLYNFHRADGFEPAGGLTLGTDGNFYGTTYYGDIPNEFCETGCGTIFKITKSGSLTTLYAFTGDMLKDGYWPSAPPIEGTDGNFYGTTCGGSCIEGTAYRVTSSGAFTFLSGLPGGSMAPLLQGTDGNFYGTTYWDDSPYEDGTIFKMTPKGIVTIVYNFDYTHGENPAATVIQGSDNNFYGTTLGGGSYNAGVVFKLTPQGAITVLHIFPDPNYPNDGSNPFAGLVQATDGNFYGVTSGGGTAGGGVIFQITPAGAYSILYNFDSAHGAGPGSTPMQHTNGMIYGLAGAGGIHKDGVVYSFDMGLGPFVSLVSTSGKVGKTIEVLGQGFTGTTAVSFNGTAATFTVERDTYLKATVPSGATTGFVTVTTPSGTLTSNKEFRVKP